MEDSGVPSRPVASPTLILSIPTCNDCAYLQVDSDGDSCELVVSVVSGPVLASGDAERCVLVSARNQCSLSGDYPSR